MNTLQPYEKFYYGFQVDGRGLRNKAQLMAEFDRRIPVYDSLLRGYLEDRGRALDLGCGYGNFLYYLKARGWSDIHGADLDVKQIELARSLDLDVELVDALSAVKGASDLKLISGFDLIEHLGKNEAVELILSSFAALKSGGMLIVQCPCADGFTGAHDLCNDLTHQWAPSSNALSQLLRAAGFQRVDIIDLSMPPFATGAKTKLILAARRIARSAVGPFLSLLGIKKPRVWSNSQIAVAFKA